MCVTATLTDVRYEQKFLPGSLFGITKLRRVTKPCPKTRKFLFLPKYYTYFFLHTLPLTVLDKLNVHYFIIFYAEIRTFSTKKRETGKVNG